MYTTSTTQTVDPADGVAKFLQDLCYNPVLRKKFQADATSVPVNQRTTKIDELLKPYGCTTDDLKGGYQSKLTFRLHNIPRFICVK